MLIITLLHKCFLIAQNSHILPVNHSGKAIERFMSKKGQIYIINNLHIILGIQCFYKVYITFQIGTITQYINFLRIVFFYQFFIRKMHITSYHGNRR